jgi:hypothetical protein
VLGGSEEEEEIGPDTLNVGWEKMMLIMFVMTLHSLTEGVGKSFRACLLATAVTVLWGFVANMTVP